MSGLASTYPAFKSIAPSLIFIVSVSKSEAAKSVLLKICGCSCTHCTHTNEDPDVLE